MLRHRLKVPFSGVHFEIAAVVSNVRVSTVRGARIHTPIDVRLGRRHSQHASQGAIVTIP